jgi:disulfide bond formation protein DsbB
MSHAEMIAIAERIVGLLSLLTLGVIAYVVVALVRRQVPDIVRNELALPFATMIAAVTTAGSLFFSEVANYTPCLLCWYQRIAMYPLVIVCGVAALRRDTEAWRTVLPIALIGAGISSWHIMIEQRPSLGGMCDPQAPCALKWINEFGFLTLPTMALIAFTAISVLALAARQKQSA